MTYNMTFMENASAQGIIQGVNSNLPNFIPLVLLLEFLVIAGTGAFANSRRTGYTNFIQWGALAGTVTTFSAFLLAGIFNASEYTAFLQTIIICIVVTIVFALATFFSDDII